MVSPHTDTIDDPQCVIVVESLANSPSVANASPGRPGLAKHQRWRHGGVVPSCVNSVAVRLLLGPEVVGGDWCAPASWFARLLPVLEQERQQPGRFHCCLLADLFRALVGYAHGGILHVEFDLDAGHDDAAEALLTNPQVQVGVCELGGPVIGVGSRPNGQPWRRYFTPCSSST